MLSDVKLIMHPLKCVIATQMMGGRGKHLNYFSNFCLYLFHCLFRYEIFLEAPTIVFHLFYFFHSVSWD